MTTTLKYATQEADVNGAPYTRRLIDEVTVTRSLQNGFYGFLSPTQIRARLANTDAGLNGMFVGADQRGALVVAKRWDAIAGGPPVTLASGRISDYEVGDEVVLSVASELPEVLLTLLPKETVTVQAFPKATDLGVTIPIVFGNVKNLPLSYIFFDRTANVYIFLVSYAGVTPTAVYRDGALVDSAEYTAYNGTYNNSVGGVGGNLTAYSVIVFVKEPMDFQGRLYDRKEGNRLTADITGLQPERNFARAIRSLWSNSTWGLGQPLDAAAFDAAEADLTAIGGLYCDGVVIDQKPAKEYLDELAGVRGMRFDVTSTGSLTVAIDKPATVYDATFGFDDQFGYRNLLEKPARRWRSTSELVSSLQVEYRFDVASGEFLSLTNSRASSPRGQAKRLSLHFVRDHTTADKWADYQAKRLRVNGQYIRTTLGLEGMALGLGSRIVVIDPTGGIYSGYEIVKQVFHLTSMEVECIPYEPDLYTYTAGTLPGDESVDLGADLSWTPPAAPSGLTKPSHGAEQASDGSTSAWVDLSWTASPTVDVTYAVQLRKNGESIWTTWDEKNTTSTRIRGLIPGIAYDYQVLSRSRQNLFSTSAAQLLNQVAPGDSTAPPAPSAIAVRQGTGKSVEIDVTFAEPADWSSVELYRNTVNNSSTASLIETKKAKRFHDVNVAFENTYHYWAKVVDFSGNKSGFSPSLNHSITPSQVGTSHLGNQTVTTPIRQLVNTYTYTPAIIAPGNTNVRQVVHNLGVRPSGVTPIVTAWDVFPRLDILIVLDAETVTSSFTVLIRNEGTSDINISVSVDYW